MLTWVTKAASLFRRRGPLVLDTAAALLGLAIDRTGLCGETIVGWLSLMFNPDRDVRDRRPLEMSGWPL
jgi:hypothetical protein